MLADVAHVTSRATIGANGESIGKGGVSVPTVYHFHPDIGSDGALNCGPLNGHDSSCERWLLTDSNEGSCEVVTQNLPLGKPHRCMHDVPSDQLEASPGRASELDVWVLGGA